MSRRPVPLEVAAGGRVHNSGAARHACQILSPIPTTPPRTSSAHQDMRLVSRRNRPLCLALALLVLLGIICAANVPSALVASPSRGHTHPIDSLLADAQQQWATKVDGQSKTLMQAVKEYKRRYGRPPPNGFDDWYETAVEVE